MLRTLYCETKFLEQFFNQKPDYNYITNESFDKWEDYKKIFFSGSNLFIEDKEKFKSLVLSNPWFKYLFDSHNGGSITIEQKTIDEAFIYNNPTAVFFLSDQQKCQQYEEDYGMLFLSNTSLNEKHILLCKTKSVPLEKDGKDLTNWGFLSEYRHPCNALIVADNYLFKPDGVINENELKNNFIEILDKLLPKKLNKTHFHLTIITGDGKTYVDLGTRLKFLESSLSKLRPYKFEIKIIGRSNGNHDRNLLTNYLHIYSGFGFTLFANRKCVKNTVISIVPKLFNHDSVNIVSCLIKQFKDTNKKIQNIGTQVVVVKNSDVENPLFL